MNDRVAGRGYSLYELVVTIGVVALVLTLGLPSFGGIESGELHPIALLNR